MRTTLLILCGIAVVLTATEVWLRAGNNGLRSQRDTLLPAHASAPTLAARPEQPAAVPPAASGELADLRRDVQKLEAEVAAAAARQPERNSDITRGMVLASDLRNRGRETPAAAFESLLWAAVHGDDSMFAEVVAIPPNDRAQTAEYLKTIGETKRTPEQIAGVLFSREVLKKAESVQVLGSTQVDATHVTLATKIRDFAESEHKGKIPMVLGPGGWQLAVPEGLAKALEQELKRQPGQASP